MSMEMGLHILFSGSAMLNTVGGRYSVNVTINGECRLTITGLQLSDAGEFFAKSLLMEDHRSSVPSCPF